MDQRALKDRIRWGWNVAARVTGAMTDLYRPGGPSGPLAPGNRVLRLTAAFQALRGTQLDTNRHGEPLWRGIFDAAYTKNGDYLVQPTGTWFIASQEGIANPLCVQTNRQISLFRPNAPVSVGTGAYGGFIAGDSTMLMEGWPASVLGISGSGYPAIGLPADTSVSAWTILMPNWPGVSLQPGDMMSDDLGRVGRLVSTELTHLGWRLTVRQASN